MLHRNCYFMVNVQLTVHLSGDDAILPVCDYLAAHNNCVRFLCEIGLLLKSTDASSPNVELTVQ